jgi:glutathione-regulated potassium-efflux system ancillary protein KefC
VFAALLSQGGEFAFVVFGVAREARVLPGQWDKLLTLTVALSMALTPLLVIGGDLVQRRLYPARKPEADRIEAEDAPVIIAGFGRFGQIVGRLLFASGLKATVLDFDPDQIELLRRFGFRIFYGDATRLDLLRAAGADRARVIVDAIDDVPSNLRLVDIVREHFPQATIVARARNVGHLQDLRRRGVTLIERELFDSALGAGRRVLEVLGVHPFEARERAFRFRRHNLGLLETLTGPIEDSERFARARAARDELERQFQMDIEEIQRLEGGDWQDERR